MPKLIVSIEGAVMKEVVLTKARTTLGRRPYHDIVFDNLAVSGDHASFTLDATQVTLEDLGSTNGTYVNGEAVRQRVLQEDDVISVAKYKLVFKADPPPAMPGPVPVPDAEAVIKVLSGRAIGRELALTKPVTTLGKPGVAVAAITRRSSGFALHHAEGEARVQINGTPIGSDAVILQDGDILELAGTRMEFVRR